MTRAKETDKTREQRDKTVTSQRQQIAALEGTVELLQKERDTFFSILERAPYGVVLLDKNGKTRFTNTAFTTITGYTLEDVPTTSDWVRLAYPDKQYRDEISASETWKKNKAQRETNGLFQKMLNRVFFRSFSVVCKDGTVKEIEFKPRALDDGSTIVMLADITERKRAEEAFRKSEKQFRLLVQHVPDILSVHDIDGNIIDMNQQACESLGYTRDELFELRVQDIEQDFLAGKHAEQWKRMVQGVPILLHGVHKRKDGTTFPVETRIGLFESGGKKMFLALVRDVTERKQMERELRESEERFKMLAEHSPLGISTMAPDKSFEYLNPRFTKIFGYTIEDIPDKDTWFEKAYPDKAYRRKIISIWKRDTANGVWVGEENPRVFTVRCKDGQDKIIDFRRVDLIDGKQYQVYEDITVRAKAGEALRESEERYRTLVENIDLKINLIDSDHNLLMVNAAQSKELTRPAHELIGKKCFREFAGRDAACSNCPGVQAIATGKPAEIEIEGVNNDGSRFNARIQAFPVSGEDGTINSFIEVAEDITERKQAEEALRESEKRYRQIVDNADDIIYGVNNKGHFTFINPVAERITRYSEHELIGRHYLDLVSPAYRKDIERFYRLQFVRRRQNTYYEFPIITKDDTEVWLGQNVQLVLEGGRVVGYQAVSRDITNRKRAEDTIRELAYQDALTGLPNRVLFNDRFSMALAQARRHQQRLGIMLLDLDHFKDINDTMGHSVGDKLLRVVGDRLTGLLRTSDTIARMGGDEFLLLFTEISRLNDIITIAQKILGVFRKPFVIDEHELFITTSIGITIFPDDGDTADILLKNADIAMYRAKERGRDNFQCYSSLPR